MVENIKYHHILSSKIDNYLRTNISQARKRYPTLGKLRTVYILERDELLMKNASPLFFVFARAATVIVSMS